MCRCHFITGKDKSEIVITWQKEIRLQLLFGDVFQIWIDGAAEVGKFNPLSLMSRLISINPQPEDQMAERGREGGREGGVEVVVGGVEMLPPNFYDTESLFNGLEDSSHLAPRRNKKGAGWCSGKMVPSS